jgi:hypothetical protein
MPDTHKCKLFIGNSDKICIRKLPPNHFEKALQKIKYIVKLHVRYSPFCVLAKVIKLVGLKNGGRVSPTNLITFADTQNGE